MPEIATEWQRFEQLSTDALYEILRFRQSIFVVEQRSPYPDLDGLDQDAWHLLLRVEGELAGYLRLVPMPLRIGRVAVALASSPPRARPQADGGGAALLSRALSGAGYRPRRAAHLSAFLCKRFSFAVTSEPYDDFGVMHVEMAIRPVDGANDAT